MFPLLNKMSPFLKRITLGPQGFLLLLFCFQKIWTIVEVERTNRDDTCIEWHVGGVCRQMFKIKSKK